MNFAPGFSLVCALPGLALVHGSPMSMLLVFLVAAQTALQAEAQQKLDELIIATKTESAKQTEDRVKVWSLPSLLGL